MIGSTREMVAAFSAMGRVGRSLSVAAHSLPRHFSTMVRLTKRMGELNICSRREADRWIREGLVSVNGRVAEIGEKVDASLPAKHIEIAPIGGKTGETSLSFKDGNAISTNLTVAVVLNKPPGYVSGQAEHGHSPATRLLTRDRFWGATSKKDKLMLPENSWKHFAPAGRLDLDSTGLLIFSRSGVIAKKLISSESTIEKEYIVGVTPAITETRQELELDNNFRLPKAGQDLSPLTAGGHFLLGEYRPLKPCKAVWIEQGSLLQIILTEGRKQQIRRACRQLLGYHVTSLERTRIGPIHLGGLPQGCWRTLAKDEIQKLMSL